MRVIALTGGHALLEEMAQIALGQVAATKPVQGRVVKFLADVAGSIGETSKSDWEEVAVLGACGCALGHVSSLMRYRDPEEGSFYATVMREKLKDVVRYVSTQKVSQVRMFVEPEEVAA